MLNSWAVFLLVHPAGIDGVFDEVDKQGSNRLGVHITFTGLAIYPAFEIYPQFRWLFPASLRKLRPARAGAEVFSNSGTRSFA